jgi:hypothetical protein
MIISTSQHILSMDDGILATCLMDSNFRVLESTSRPSFIKRFQISDKVKKNGGDYAAVMFGTAQISAEAFGEVKLLVVDYDTVKTVLLPIVGMGYVGLVVNQSTNAEYLALKIQSMLETKQDIESYV